MKHTLFILALITASIQTFAQSPRIKLNQITKDSLAGSVLISSPTDSGMVYSRDLFISYGADTVLILGGDTLAKTSGIISSVLSDGVTITGDGTLGSELTADTSVLATLRALSDSLALVISSVTADNVTITGDGTVGSPLTVDTTTYIATKQDLDAKQDQLNGTGFVKATGTTISYDNSTYLTSEVDGDVSNELQTLSYNSSTNEITLSDGGGTEDLSNLDLVDSTRINATGDTAYYYQNGTLIGTGAIAGGGGGTTYNNITEGNDTVYVSDHLVVDTFTLFVDADSNRVGIGTSSPTQTVEVNLDHSGVNNRFFIQPRTESFQRAGQGFGAINNNLNAYAFNADTSYVSFTIDVFDSKTSLNDVGFNSDYQFINVSNKDVSAGAIALYKMGALQLTNAYSNGGYGYISFGSEYFNTVTPQRVGINTVNPTQSLDVNGTMRLRTLVSGTNAGFGRNTSTGEITALSSDMRLKRNITTIPNALDKTLNLRGVNFYWDDSNDPDFLIDSTSKDILQIGLIAQEVEEVLPEAVYFNGVKNYKAVRYGEIVGVLIEAIKEQQAIIETQATEIEQLKTLITDLSNRLQILENN